MSTLKELLPIPTDEHIGSEDDATGNTSTRTIDALPASARTDVKYVTKSLSNSKRDEVDYSAVVRLGENAERTVYSRYDAMIEKPREEVLRSSPTQASVDDTTRKTKTALEGILTSKLPISSSKQSKQIPTFIRYAPANSSNGSQTASRQRIIKMVQAPQDPMNPPRFTQRKAPVNPPSPPVPVMHSPERKLSKLEAAEWNIPPVVSDWKNNRGYTISLDKRLAADGRALTNRAINDRFAQMAEALYQAEKTARDEVEKRASLQRQVSVRAKAARERELRDLAEKARQERREFLGLSERSDTESIIGTRGGGNGHEMNAHEGREVQVEDEAPPMLPSAKDSSIRYGTHKRRSRFSDVEGSSQPNSEVHVDADRNVRMRDEIRTERRLQREKEMRLRELHGDQTERPMLKRSKNTRDLDRDVSEQAALGQSVEKTAAGEVLYDERLFNQDGGKSSFTGGYGADDSYNLYDAPLFNGSVLTARNLHVRRNPSGGMDEDLEAKRGNLVQTSNNKESEHGRGRAGPVEFERDNGGNSISNDDPYGLNRFLSAADNNG